MKVRLSWLWLVALAAGCGSGTANQPKLMPVGGTVTLDGKPVSGVMLSFHPTGSTRGAGAGGCTDKAGKYALTAKRGGKGAPVGDYRVAATKLVMPDGSDFRYDANVAPIDSPARQVLPPKYSEIYRTVLKATVCDGPNTVDFQLSSKP